MAANNEIVRFDTNVPVLVALKYDEGKLMEGRYGDQIMYTLEGGKITFVPPIIEKKIQELAIRKGEEFEICKREVKNGRTKTIQWDVRRLDPKPATGSAVPITVNPVEGPTPLETTLHASLAIVDGKKNGNGGAAVPPQPSVSRPPAADATQQKANGATSPPSSLAGTHAPPVMHTQSSALMAGALIASVDSLLTARAYALQKGMPLQFNEEDVRCVAASIYIQYFKEAEMHQRRRNEDLRAQNGSGPWPQ